MSKGILKLIQWDAVPEHPGLPYWDQRIVYNHAVLAHLGRRAYLAMIDIDEYVRVVLKLVVLLGGHAQPLLCMQHLH